MGNQAARPPAEFHVWVLGQRDAGKTHLIDAIKYNGDTSKQPTNGYYIEQYEHMEQLLTLREFGQTEHLVQRLSGSEILKLYGAPQCIWYVTKSQKSLQSYHLDVNTLLYTLKAVNGHQDAIDCDPIPVAIVVNTKGNSLKVFDTLQTGILESNLHPNDIHKARKAVALDNLIRTLRLDHYEGRVYACEISGTENLSIRKLLNWTVDSCNRPTLRPYRHEEHKDPIHFLEPIVTISEEDDDDDDGFLG